MINNRWCSIMTSMVLMTVTGLLAEQEAAGTGTNAAATNMAYKTLVTYKALSEAEKKADDGLRFLVTFDKFDANADLAKGQKYSKALRDVSLALRGNIGFDGQNAFSPLPGEQLKFEVKDNVSIERGTVCLWLKAENYVPAGSTPDGKKRGNINYFSIVFENQDAWVKFYLYEYAGVIYWDWSNSFPPQRFGSVGRCSAGLQGIGKDEWFQVVATWDQRDWRLYLNGEPALPVVTLPEKSRQSYGLEPDKDKSFIGVRAKIFEDDSQWKTVVDDVKIYERALSPIEVKKQYWNVVASAQKLAVDDFDLELAGLDDQSAATGSLAVFLQFNALPEKYRNEIKTQGVKADWRLTGPGTHSETGRWSVSALDAFETLPVTSQGVYQVSVSLAGRDGTTFKSSKSIECPDLAFLHSRAVDDATVPAPWAPLSVDDQNAVKVWKREYLFKNGPFPDQILIAGRPIFLQPPALAVQTPSGPAGIEFKIMSREVCPQGSYVIFKGQGKSRGFSVNFQTRVEFDGFIGTDFLFQGAPAINSMKLGWKVRPEFSRYLLTPTLVETNIFEEIFPAQGLGNYGTHELWLASEQGGFCWSAESDAHWVNNPGEKVLKAIAAEGLCEVTMVSRPVQLPENVSYSALFIATPTRPLVQPRGRGCRISIIGWHGEMLTSIGSFDPDPVGFPCAMMTLRPHSQALYGMGHALTSQSIIGHYFEKYWNIPMDYSYAFSYWKPLKDGGVQRLTSPSLSCCPNTAFHNYFPFYLQKLFKERFADRIAMIYYDLGGITRCSSKLHHCAFEDSFGREINKYTLLGMRRMIKRTVRLCHENGRTFMLHGQRDFYPFFSGLADYWYPGEQYGKILKRNPYAYTDEISDNLYMSEHNSGVLGARVVFLPNLGQVNPDYNKHPEYTEAMLTMLLAYDIETSPVWTAPAVVKKVWNIFDKYRAYESWPHLFYAQREVKSANPEVRITWHECPDGLFLLALCNKGSKAQTTEVDVSALGVTNLVAREEYQGSDITIAHGKFNISLPFRSFRLVGLPPARAPLSYADSMDPPDTKMWSTWAASPGLGIFALDGEVGHDQPGSQLIELSPLAPTNGSLSYSKDFPHIAGSYTAAVYGRTEGIADEAEVTFSAQLLANDKFVKTIKTSKLAEPQTGAWQKIELVFDVPQEKGNPNDFKVRYSLGVKNAIRGKVWFDDFKLDIARDN